MDNSFCVMPFLHLNVWQNGRIRPCCISKDIGDVDLKVDSIEEAYNSGEFKKLRSDMIKGTQNSICSVCYDQERINSVSYRNVQNKKYAHFIEELKNNTNMDGSIKLNFRNLDLRLSNNCNLKCRTCSDESSTSWIKEKEELNKRFNWGVSPTNKLTSLNFDIDPNYIENVEHIYFAGGEPLYMREMYSFLDGVKNKENVILFINTNFTIIKEGIFTDLFSKMKGVHFLISCDGVEDVGEYVRTNVKWEAFKNNIETLISYEKKISSIHHTFQYTCSILNCFHFFKYRKYLYEHEFITNDNQIKFSYVSYPFWFDILNFEEIKIKAIQYIQEGIADINTESSLYVDLINYLNHLNLSSGENDKKISRDFLSKNINFGNEFNSTELPVDLNYLKSYL